MKIKIILVICGLIISPVLMLAQTSETQVAPTQSTNTPTTTDTVPTTRQESAQVFPPKEIGTPTRCGVLYYKPYNQCEGSNTYKNIYAQCFDGFGVTLEEILCKSYEELTQLANEACINHCSVSSEPPTTPAIPETAVPAKEQTPTTTPGASASTTVATSLDTKCGVFSSVVSNECGAGVYKNIYAQCYDGFEVTLGETTSCKPADLWNQYAKEACASHCSKGGGSGAVSTEAPTPIYYYKETTEGGNRYTPLGPSSVPTVEQEWVSVCTTIDRLTQNYNETVLELQKQEALSSKGKIEDLTRSLENQKKYMEDAKKICATDPQMAWQVGAPPKVMESKPIYTQESKPVTPTIKPVEIPRTTPVCYISDDLMQKYNQLIIELQKSESDKTRAELITKEIIALKQQITTQQNECVRNSPQPTPRIVPWPAPTLAPKSTPTSQPIEIKNIPVAVSINHCNEVAQWETKIAYYKKISGLSNDELKKSGFSREEIEKITQELSLGIEKVRGQCDGRENIPAMPKITAITGSASITETVKPVVIESGQEISDYYKARIEKAVSIKGEEKQIQELKTLRDEIDRLISNLIKSRKELEVSELNTLVKEVKVSRGEIKADDIAVKTTEKKMLINVGDRPVSVEPTVSQVIIRDKGLEVSADEVMIKENVLSVGGVDVKMSASEVSENLGFTPATIELNEENDKAVYTMKIKERRKLFWFIPLNVSRTVAVDAENGNTLSEQRPWYSFLTTK